VTSKKLSIRGMIYASIFGAVTAAGAYIMIPLPPVPITLQTLFLYLAATLLGGRVAALSQVIYILVGIIGLPVFAGGKAGLGVLIGPTGGYLIGFIAGAYVIGKLVEIRKAPGLIWIISSMVTGTVAIYLFGVGQLMIIAKLSMVKAITVGAFPFLIGDVLKIVVASLLTLKIRDKIKI